ncbi:MAG TPA: hypothetical protein VN524_03680 [Hyphomicrobiaceae bacterium]|nr:hypothetical protein [Hyphomicrobiaceae bacterium]
MTKLSRQPDGSYCGTYKDIEITVRKETVATRSKHNKRWVARSAGYQPGAGDTRADAVRRLCRIVDMEAVGIPELDWLLERWTEEVKAIVSRLDDKDAVARMKLEDLQWELRHLDHEVRRAALHFQEKLAKLKTRAQQQPEPLALEATR